MAAKKNFANTVVLCAIQYYEKPAISAQKLQRVAHETTL